jgi:type IV secretory pathway TrbF-like protein
MNTTQSISEEEMATQQAMTDQPEITRAAQRYLEQYGDPMVMNTYLKVALLAMAAVCVALSAVVIKSHQALAAVKPLIIRIDSVGHAEAIDYRSFQYRPMEAENKYYLGRWAELFFSRDRFTLMHDQTAALYFMNSDIQHDVIDAERKDDTFGKYTKDALLPTISTVVTNVILDDLKTSPYSARIEFMRVYTDPQDLHEIKREKLTASVTYVFRDSVHNQQLAVNPLGLTIVRFRFDQAFN